MSFSVSFVRSFRFSSFCLGFMARVFVCTSVALELLFLIRSILSFDVGEGRGEGEEKAHWNGWKGSFMREFYSHIVYSLSVLLYLALLPSLEIQKSSKELSCSTAGGQSLRFSSRLSSGRGSKENPSRLAHGSKPPKTKSLGRMRTWWNSPGPSWGTARTRGKGEVKREEEGRGREERERREDRTLPISNELR